MTFTNYSILLLLLFFSQLVLVEVTEIVYAPDKHLRRGLLLLSVICPLRRVLIIVSPEQLRLFFIFIGGNHHLIILLWLINRVLANCLSRQNAIQYIVDNFNLLRLQFFLLMIFHAVRQGFRIITVCLGLFLILDPLFFIVLFKIGFENP